ncbi:unnamed protein product [Caenorhabditis sp. 36 PRJEB53466]|nr:unnamed protein product [Caenorhabditis sp. 36 PRJEB53466]
MFRKESLQGYPARLLDANGLPTIHTTTFFANGHRLNCEVPKVLFDQRPPGFPDFLRDVESKTGTRITFLGNQSRYSSTIQFAGSAKALPAALEMVEEIFKIIKDDMCPEPAEDSSGDSRDAEEMEDESIESTTEEKESDSSTELASEIETPVVELLPPVRTSLPTTADCLAALDRCTPRTSQQPNVAVEGSSSSSNVVATPLAPFDFNDPANSTFLAQMFGLGLRQMATYSAIINGQAPPSVESAAIPDLEAFRTPEGNASLVHLISIGIATIQELFAQYEPPRTVPVTNATGSATLPSFHPAKFQNRPFPSHHPRADLPLALKRNFLTRGYPANSEEEPFPVLYARGVQLFGRMATYRAELEPKRDVKQLFRALDLYKLKEEEMIEQIVHGVHSYTHNSTELLKKIVTETEVFMADVEARFVVLRTTSNMLRNSTTEVIQLAWEEYDLMFTEFLRTESKFHKTMVDLIAVIDIDVVMPVDVKNANPNESVQSVLKRQLKIKRSDRAPYRRRKTKNHEKSPFDQPASGATSHFSRAAMFHPVPSLVFLTILAFHGISAFVLNNRTGNANETMVRYERAPETVKLTYELAPYHSDFYGKTVAPVTPRPHVLPPPHDEKQCSSNLCVFDWAPESIGPFIVAGMFMVFAVFAFLTLCCCFFRIFF